MKPLGSSRRKFLKQTGLVATGLSGLHAQGPPRVPVIDCHAHVGLWVAKTASGRAEGVK